MNQGRTFLYSMARVRLRCHRSWYFAGRWRLVNRHRASPTSELAPGIAPRPTQTAVAACSESYLRHASPWLRTRRRRTQLLQLRENFGGNRPRYGSLLRRPLVQHRHAYNAHESQNEYDGRRQSSRARAGHTASTCRRRRRQPARSMGLRASHSSATSVNPLSRSGSMFPDAAGETSDRTSRAKLVTPKRRS
jgi:hypothetical protein